MTHERELTTTEDTRDVVERIGARWGLHSELAVGETLAATIFPDGKATPAQVRALCIVADQYGLNPFTKEIYAFPSQGGIVPMVSVDGWYKLMNSHPQFDGVVTEAEKDDSGAVVAVTAKVYRKDRKYPVEVTEYLAECKRGTGPWKSHPARMLRHRAITQAARVAFGFSGIHDEDEGARIVEAREVRTSRPVFDPNADADVSEPASLEVESRAAVNVETLPHDFGVYPFDVGEEDGSWPDWKTELVPGKKWTWGQMANLDPDEDEDAAILAEMRAGLEKWVTRARDGGDVSQSGRRLAVTMRRHAETREGVGA